MKVPFHKARITSLISKIVLGPLKPGILAGMFLNCGAMERRTGFGGSLAAAQGSLPLKIHGAKSVYLRPFHSIFLRQPNTNLFHINAKISPAQINTRDTSFDKLIYNLIIL